MVEYWLADLDLEARIAPATRFNYERDMNRLVLPAFRGYTLREIGVARCDALLKELGKQSHARSKRAKTVLRLAFGLAVRHEVIHRNPIDGGVPQPGGDAAYDGQRETPASQGPRRRRHRRSQSAHVSPHRRDGDQ